jgi:hypothetical protein
LKEWKNLKRRKKRRVKLRRWMTDRRMVRVAFGEREGERVRRRFRGTG